jgi:membrane protease YdiL (CAAX protease family)
MSAYQSAERHPVIPFLQLLMLILGGTLLFTCLAIVAGFLFYGAGDMTQFQELLRSVGDNQSGLLKFIQMASSIGTFIVPALLFAKMQSTNTAEYLQADRPPSAPLMLVSIALMFSIVPLIEWTITINQHMHLPEFLDGVETWMRKKEDELEILTKQLLMMTSFSDLLINLLMIAVLPAIGEELIFRGCFQKIFSRWANSYHWGIWLAAILFSAIHVQFYGFLPRMLLGALFGYLFVWGRSIWLPIVAHFINNATTVIAAFIYQIKGKSLDTLDEPSPYGWPVYVLSAALTGYLLWFLYHKQYIVFNEDGSVDDGRGLD